MRLHREGGTDEKAATTKLACYDRAWRHAGGTDDRADVDNSAEPPTTTPIEHLMVLIGEDHTFDNVFATYQSSRKQQIGNLLSRGIINADGSPGPNSSAAEQFSVNTPFPTDSRYFTSVDSANQSPYTTFPTPNISTQ
jgi:phospholipase C